MLCRCGREDAFLSEGVAVCTGCFIYQFEKRVKRTLSEHSLKKGDKVRVVGELAEYVFKKLVPIPLDATFVSSVSGVKKDYDAVVMEWTLEDECAEFLRAMGGDGTFTSDASAIHLFRSLAEEDVLRYAELRGIRFTPAAKDEHWLRFLKSFDDHPEMKRNMLRMADEFRKIDMKKSE